MQQKICTKGEQQQGQERFGLFRRAIEGRRVWRGGEKGAVDEGFDCEPEEGTAAIHQSVSQSMELQGAGLDGARFGMQTYSK